MIDIAGDFHTHTVHSHGTGSVEDNVKAAIDRGLAAVAISDHGMAHPFYGIRSMEKYLRDIEDVRERYADQIRVYSGYEGNLQSLKGRVDLPEGWTDAIDFPFFGYHRMVRYPNPADFFHFMMPKSHSDSAVEKNTRAVSAALEKSPAMMVSHPGYGLPVDKTALARAAAASGKALEINAKHPEFTVEELRDAARAGAKFIIGSDAHSPGRVGDFRAAIEKAEQAGISPSQILNSRENIDSFLASLEERRRRRGPRQFRDVLGRAYGGS
ncbi:MAG: PHP domain-containing protein [Clostridia bacterium]|nr:PHP domain-containing protein [Clostridia bacterium]